MHAKFLLFQKLLLAAIIFVCERFLDFGVFQHFSAFGAPLHP